MLEAEGSLSDTSKGWRPTAFYRNEGSQDGSNGDEGSLVFTPMLDLQLTSLSFRSAVRRGSTSKCLPWALQVEEEGWQEQFAPEVAEEEASPTSRGSGESAPAAKRPRRKKKKSTIVMAAPNEKPREGAVRQTVAFQNQMVAGLERYQRVVRARESAIGANS